MKTNRGFTLVEMLVVISIIGVLVSILVPAVQHAREAARRAACQAHMSQVAKGIATYESRKGYLPAARTLAKAGNIQNWVVPVLPMLDRQDLADSVWKANGSTALVANESLPFLVCPDDPACKQSGVLSYRVNGGRENQTFVDTRAGVTYGNSDFLANGLFIDQSFAWPVRGEHYQQNLNRSCLEQCKDGTTNTILLAENLVVLSRLNPQTISLWSTAGQEQDACVLWFNDRASNPQEFVGLNQDETDTKGQPSATIRWARPASYHPGGFVLAFADGSVRFMSDAVDHQVYAVLMTSHGAKVRDPKTGDADCPWQAANDPAFPGTKF